MNLVAKILAGLALILAGAPSSARSEGDEGFTMSSGPLLGGANGTEGA